jgi:hypothetical protein
MLNVDCATVVPATVTAKERQLAMSVLPLEVPVCFHHCISGSAFAFEDVRLPAGCGTVPLNKQHQHRLRSATLGIVSAYAFDFALVLILCTTAHDSHAYTCVRRARTVPGCLNRDCNVVRLLTPVTSSVCTDMAFPSSNAAQS